MRKYPLDHKDVDLVTLLLRSYYEKLSVQKVENGIVLTSQQKAHMRRCEKLLNTFKPTKNQKYLS